MDKPPILSLPMLTKLAQRLWLNGKQHPKGVAAQSDKGIAWSAWARAISFAVIFPPASCVVRTKVTAFQQRWMSGYDSAAQPPLRPDS